MSTNDRYATTPDADRWDVPGTFDTTFRWEYDDGRESLLKLYSKGKKRQWDSDDRIDWSQDIDPENPGQLPDESIPIFASDVFRRLTPKEKVNVRRHFQSWQLSQFLHGEQGALICTAKIVQQVPMMDAKFYAATQVVDEARHVEVYSRLLHEKFELAYPITPTLQSLLGNVISDGRWDMTYLGMQAPHRGSGAGRLRHDPRSVAEPAGRRCECLRHAGRGAARGLRAPGPARLLPAAERQGARRARGVRRRGLPSAARPLPGRGSVGDARAPRGRVAAHVDDSDLMRAYRSALFSRVVPTIREIGLWGPRIRKAYADMGILGYADIDAAALSAADERVAEEFDARRPRAGASTAAA